MKSSHVAALSIIFLAACSSVNDEALGRSTHALSASDVLGFENSAHWSASSGVKSASNDASQGSSALALSGFSYAQVTSTALDSLGPVSSTLSLDIKLPNAASWGEVRVILRAPSVGLWYQDLGAKPLASLSAGSYQTVQFAVPAAVVSALGSAPSDLTFQLEVNGPYFANAVLFDNLRFEGAQTKAKIEIRVPLADDLVYLEVNGVRHRGRTGVKTLQSSMLGAT